MEAPLILIVVQMVGSLWVKKLSPPTGQEINVDI